MRSYSELLEDAQRHFNRREFEQFINPLLQLQAETFEKTMKLQVKGLIDKFYYETLYRVNNNSEELVGDTKRIIDVDELKLIFESVKATII